MAKSESYINFIIEQLRSGNISHNEVMTVFVSKWQLSERQFTRHWNTANELYTNELRVIESEKTALYSESQLQAAKDEIADDIETKKAATIALRMAVNQLTKEGLKDQPDLKLIATVSKIVLDTRKTLGYEKINVATVNQNIEEMTPERQKEIEHKFRQMIA